MSNRPWTCVKWKKYVNSTYGDHWGWNNFNHYFILTINYYKTVLNQKKEKCSLPKMLNNYAVVRRAYWPRRNAPMKWAAAIVSFKNWQQKQWSVRTLSRVTVSSCYDGNSLAIHFRYVGLCSRLPLTTNKRHQRLCIVTAKTNLEIENLIRRSHCFPLE